MENCGRHKKNEAVVSRWKQVCNYGYVCRSRVLKRFFVWLFGASEKITMARNECAVKVKKSNYISVSRKGKHKQVQLNANTLRKFKKKKVLLSAALN